MEVTLTDTCAHCHGRMQFIPHIGWECSLCFCPSSEEAVIEGVRVHDIDPPENEQQLDEADRAALVRQQRRLSL